MSKTWTLDELEQLSDEELCLLIPKNIEEQFNCLPTQSSAIRIKGLKVPFQTPLKMYKTKEGYIELLNGDLLYIFDTQTIWGALS